MIRRILFVLGVVVGVLGVVLMAAATACLRLGDGLVAGDFVTRS